MEIEKEEIDILDGCDEKIDKIKQIEIFDSSEKKKNWTVFHVLLA